MAGVVARAGHRHRHKGGRVVDVADRQRAAHCRGGPLGLRAVQNTGQFRHRTADGAADHGRVVGTVDRDRDGLCRAVDCGNRDAIRVSGAADKLVVGGVGAVVPGANAVDREMTVAVAAGDTGLHHKGDRTVHVAGTQDAAGADIGCAVGLGHVGRARARDHGCIVGAGDGHRDGLRGAVRGGHGDAVRVGGPANKLVVRAVSAVVPGANAVDREVAVAMVARNAGLRHKGGRIVHVGSAQGAAGADICCAVGFGQAGRARSRDHCCVVGASYRNGKCLFSRDISAVISSDLEPDRPVLPHVERVNGRGVRGKQVVASGFFNGQRAVGIGAADVGAIVRPTRDAVADRVALGIGGNQTAGQRTADNGRRTSAGGVKQGNDGWRCQDRGVVGAGQIDRQRARAVPNAVKTRDGEHFRRMLVLHQGIDDS